MPRMYGILAIVGWVAAVITAVLLVVAPKRADVDPTHSNETFDQ